MRLGVLGICLLAQSVTWDTPAVGTMAADGTYTAPASVPVARSVTLTARTPSGTAASVTLALQANPCVPKPETLTLSPNGGTLKPGESLHFTTTVTPAVPCTTPPDPPVTPPPGDIPFGVIRSPAPEPDPSSPGSILRQDLPEVRNAEIKDRNTGALIKRVSLRGDHAGSKKFDTGSGGAHERTSPVADGDWVLLTGFQGDAANVAYAVNQVTGESRLLGSMTFTLPGVPGVRQHVMDHDLFDAANPRRMYSQPSSTGHVLQLDYLKPYVENPQGTRADFQVTTLTTDLHAAVMAFHAANGNAYGEHDPAAFTRCSIYDVYGDALKVMCRYGIQDSVAWIGAFSIAQKKIVALAPAHAMPASRWCPVHQQEIADAAVWAGTTQTFKGGGPGLGPYTTTLAEPLTPTGTTLVLAGQLVSVNEPKHLMDLAAGDLLKIGSEWVRLVRKLGSNKWEIARGIGGTAAAGYPVGLTINAACGNWPGAGPTQYPDTRSSSFVFVWDYARDPFGKDTTGQFQWANRYIGHASGRGNRLLNVRSVAESPAGTKIWEQRDPAYIYSIIESPYSDGRHAPGEGNTYQKHPYCREGLDWCVDVEPFIGGALFGGPGSATRVAGFQNVYKYTSRDTDGINPEVLNTVGYCGVKILRGVVTQLADDKPYQFCGARVDGECVSGSKVGEWYVSCPGVTTLGCSGGENLTGQTDICLGDQSMFGGALVQIGLGPNRVGVPATHPVNVRGVGFSRVLARAGLNHTRGISGTANAKILPNGRWVLATYYGVDRRDLVLVKVP